MLTVNSLWTSNDFSQSTGANSGLNKRLKELLPSSPLLSCSLVCYGCSSSRSINSLKASEWTSTLFSQARSVAFSSFSNHTHPLTLLGQASVKFDWDSVHNSDRYLDKIALWHSQNLSSPQSALKPFLELDIT